MIKTKFKFFQVVKFEFPTLLFCLKITKYLFVFLVFKQLTFPHTFKTMKYFDGLLFQLITK